MEGRPVATAMMSYLITPRMKGEKRGKKQPAQRSPKGEIFLKNHRQYRSRPNQPAHFFSHSLWLLLFFRPSCKTMRNCRAHLQLPSYYYHGLGLARPGLFVPSFVTAMAV